MRYLYVCFFLLQLNLFGQEKYEQERRVQQEGVPQNAWQSLLVLSPKPRIKWYREQSLKRVSYEAKFTYKKSKYSVEFDSNGELEDIEIRIKWSAIPVSVQSKIQTELQRECEKYRMRKLQIQYEGDSRLLLAKLKDDTENPALIQNYEIVAKCRKLGKTDLYEFLFDEQGKMLRASKIIFENASNLEY